MATLLSAGRTARRITDNGKRRMLRKNILSNLLFGIVRGVGMAVGFSGIAVVLIFLTRFLPLGDIPFLSDLIDRMIANHGS
jgi:hypothetical protein